MLIKYSIVFLSVLSFSCTGVAHLQTQKTPIASMSEKECITMPFHYVLVDNWEKSSTVREIEIFMDDKAFTLENLKMLFAYFSDRFPEPKLLIVRVKTDWSQLNLPSDCPGAGSGGSNIAKVENFDHHRADYYRRGNDVYFYYTTKLKTETMEKVVLSGNHQPRQRWESK
ncbi:MAG: hypothetical protein JSS77_11880 [Acidobacteria bacterium]|nr:hypothetical protein [Acidobacteriota bacterium]HMU34436.1 hypothetical protein [Pyrinomonadaceae bacterium]